MSKYPSVADENFYTKINKIYEKYKSKENRKSIKQICNPQKFELQMPQKFLSEFINPKTPYTGVLVYHRIGAGKTCTAVRIGEQWKHKYRIIVVVPASLKTNFRNELRSACADGHYLKKSEEKLLKELHPTDPEYKKIIELSNKRMDKYYDIYSYHKFINLVKDEKISLNKCVLIIDEIQNMISEYGIFYTNLKKLIDKSDKNLRVILLSATPMFDKPNEIALTMNLLRIPVPLPTGTDFNRLFIDVRYNNKGRVEYRTKNMDLFKKHIKGYISYFRGAPPIVFPHMDIKYVKCRMDTFQYRAYKIVNEAESKKYQAKKKKLEENLDVSDLSNNFFIGTRIISNIVYPNKKINKTGFDILTKKEIRENLGKYSCKFKKLYSNIRREEGKIFIYSEFKNYGGIKAFTKVLEAHGYKDYAVHGEGHKRYAVWSGDESINKKEEIRSVYNLRENNDGSIIKILLGTSAIKEGVSLKAVRYVHILEPYWNMSRLDQIIGRASRLCSHKDLPESERNVQVYIYLAKLPKEVYEKNRSQMSVDEYILNIAVEKQKIIKEFELAIKESAIDCMLNYKANVYPGEEPIKCDV